MKMKFLLIFFFTISIISAQVENVELEHDIYKYLKEMKVKGVIGSIHDNLPNMSRLEILNFLNEIDSKKDALSETETKLLRKYLIEFNPNLQNADNTAQLVGGSDTYDTGLDLFFSDKLKYFYSYRDKNINFYFNLLGNFNHGQQFDPIMNNSEIYDIGFRGRGTILGKLGYMLKVVKGGVSGSIDEAPNYDPRLNYNFKFNEGIENIRNYDFAEGYLRYYDEPTENMNYSFQIGREKVRFGYGYSNSLILTGDHAYIDFIRIGFSYGVFRFTSFHGSTVGDFSEVRDSNYTKYIAANVFTLSIPKFIDFSLGEQIIYSGRGLDLAYLNPFSFYKFTEMSLQDRDNGILYLDLQTHFLRNFEIQGTFYLDEDILSNLQDMSRFSNKTAYQLGFIWYSPFDFSDFSFSAEFTKIRPYVYSHTNLKNAVTAYGGNLGHRIGPNAEELMARITYNFSDRLRFELEYTNTRSGENVVDSSGDLIKNVGGDSKVPHRMDIDSNEAYFLDGIKINKSNFKLLVRYEPLRNIIFDFIVNYSNQNNISYDRSNDLTYGMVKMYLQF